MEISQLDITNIFLGILAGLAVLQMAAAIAVVIWLKRTASRVAHAAAHFESTYIAPIVQESQQLARQTRQVISDLQPVVVRAKTLVGGIESRTENALTAVHAVNEQVHSGLNQLKAIEHGLRRGVETLVNSTHR